MEHEEKTLEQKLSRTLNGYENESNTSDVVLAQFAKGCLDSFNKAVNRRDEGYGINPYPGKSLSTKLFDLLTPYLDKTIYAAPNEYALARAVEGFLEGILD